MKEYYRYKTNKYGSIYYCNHPIYNVCTLFKIHNQGLAIIQQRFNKNTKETYWTNIDECLIDDIYLNSNFKQVFDMYSKKSTDNLYPTLTIRQLMYALKMKPLARKEWETYFDKKPI